MNRPLVRKLEKLRKTIRGIESAVVAYSGGVDSTLLTRICREELGEKAVAVTALSEDYPHTELVIARRIAKVLGIRHVTSKMHESDPEERSEELFSRLNNLKSKLRVAAVLDGAHTDDVREMGKSYTSAKKAGVRSPFLECGISKSEVRLISKHLGLPNWDKKSSGSSRSARRDLLQRYESAEKYLSRMGIKDTILQKNGSMLIISCGRESLQKLSQNITNVEKKMNSLGFKGVLLNFCKR